jgi:hypothetical protein
MEVILMCDKNKKRMNENMTVRGGIKNLTKIIGGKALK